MKISLHNAGKRFNRDWIFRHFNHEFLSGHSYAITGPNGSGKSTLLQVIAGATLHSEGSIMYDNNGPVNDIAAYKQIALAAPYLDLIEELTATEFLDFHSGFKNLVLSIPEILQQVNLQDAANKQIRYFSSGMKQRLKLAQAFFSASAVLLLDEPTTNLDSEGTALYQRLIKDHSKERLVIISSNVPQEYEFCQTLIAMQEFK
jgi:ABC-type multidrug transport system ATPase subunit